MFVGAAVGTGVGDGVAIEVGDGVGVLVWVAVGTAVGDGVAVEVGAGVGVFVGAAVGTGVGDGVMVAVGDGVGVVVGEGVGAAVGEGVTTSVCVVCVSVGAAVRTGGMVVGESVAVVVGAVVGDAVGTGVGLLAEHATRDMTSAPNSSNAGIGVRMAYVMRVFSHSLDSDFVGSVCHPSNSNPATHIIRLPGENGVLSIVTFVMSNTERRGVSGWAGLPR